MEPLIEYVEVSNEDGGFLVPASLVPVLMRFVIDSVHDADSPEHRKQVDQFRQSLADNRSPTIAGHPSE